MNNKLKWFVIAVSVITGIVVTGVPIFAHHGSAISYDMEHPWNTKATVTEFRYINPHPIVFFDRVNDKGEVEHWESEIITNPSNMIRAGWGKSRSEEALKPGTKVTLTLGTSKAGGHSAVIMKIVNEQGEEIITRRGGRGGGGRQ